MIAGDHHRPDACGLADLHRGPRFGSRGSIIATRPSSVIWLFRILERRAGLPRDREHAQAFAGHALLDGADALATGLRQRDVFAGPQLARATRQHFVGGPFRVRAPTPAGRRVKRGHATPLRRERDLSDARLLLD